MHQVSLLAACESVTHTDCLEQAALTSSRSPWAARSELSMWSHVLTPVYHIGGESATAEPQIISVNVPRSLGIMELVEETSYQATGISKKPTERHSISIVLCKITLF